MFAPHSELILSKIFKDFQNSISYSIKIGCEIEFFLYGKFDNEFISNFEKILKDKFSIIYQLQEEQGHNQFEVKTIAISDIIYLANQLDEIREFIKEFCLKKDLEAIFNAKPEIDDCANALQFNISLHDSNNNLFANYDNEIYQKVIAILYLNSEKLLFLSSQDETDFKRFDYDDNIKLHKLGKYPAPTNYSQGKDNRTCLIRALKNRLEFRLASANCNIHLNLAALLFYIKQSFILDVKTNSQIIYGNSFDEKYNNKKLENYKEAKKIFLESELFDLFNNIIGQ